jgi:acetyl esterase/lipase
MGSTPGRPAVPLLMVVGNSDGTGDGVMVSKDVEALAHEYCQQGVAVDFVEEYGAGHTEAAIPFEAVLGPAQIQAWFAGLTPVNDCLLVGRGNSLAPLPAG